MLGVVFGLLRTWFTRSKPEHVVAYDVATLAVYADVPRVQRVLLHARGENDVELLLRVQAAKEELARANETRKRNAAHPVLEGSPTTYGWKVEERAQSLAIRQGLEDAVNSTIFDPHQPRITPLPLDGHSMKEMFYEYHENNPQLRNLPPSRRNAEELIFTIEGTRWKITLSSSQANFIANSVRGDEPLQDANNLAGSPPSIIHAPTARRGSILDTDFQISPSVAAPIHRPTTPTPPPPPSAYLARSLPTQPRAPLVRSASRSSRLPRVASKLSIASHTSTDIQADESGAFTSHGEESQAESHSSSSRAASPARSPLYPRSPSTSRLSGSGPGSLRRPSAVLANSGSGTIKCSRKLPGRPYVYTSGGDPSALLYSHPLRPTSPLRRAGASSSSLPIHSRPSSRHSSYMDAAQFCLPPTAPPRRGSIANASRASSRLAQRSPSGSQHRSHREGSPSPSSGSTASSVHTPITPKTPLSEVRSMRSSSHMRTRKAAGTITGSGNQELISQTSTLPRRKRSSTVSEESPTVSLNAARKRAMLVALRNGGAGSVNLTNVPQSPCQDSDPVGIRRHNSTPSTGAESRANHA